MERLHYRFGAVLGLILATLAFGLAAPDGDLARVVNVALQSATLVAAAVASRAHAWVIRLCAAVSVLFVLGALVAILGTKNFGSDSARLVGLLIVVLIPPAIATGVVRHAREERGITLQTMFGVLCLYLLIGLAYASACETIQAVFNDPPLAPLDPQYYGDGVTHAEFLYFSFATLTTVGYGDLVAITNLGRSLAITEALIGQIYLVTVVALIVSNLRAPRRGRVGE